MAIENSLDLMLALLYSPGASGKEGETIKGFTRVQKLFFLLWKEGNFDKYVSELKEFEAYNYGPFSNSLYDDIEFARSIGLIKVTKVKPELQLENVDEIEVTQDELDFKEIDPSNIKTREDYDLTEKRGIEIAKEIWKEISPEDRIKIRRIKTIYNQMPFMKLIRYVYSKYPDYAKKSLLVL